MKTIVVDIDGTLSDSRAREHFAQNKDWDAFHEHMMEDPPHEDVACLIRSLSDSAQIIGCTGRSEIYRKATTEWLALHDIPLEFILMRPEFDFRSDYIIKPELLIGWHRASSTVPGQTAQERVAFILDDRDRVVQAWRELGFNCWQVRLGGY